MCIFGIFLTILPILPHFTPFFQMCDFREKLYNNNRHHFRPFSAKSLDSIFFKSPKTSFLGYFGLFWAQIPKKRLNEHFSEKSGSVTFLPLWSPNFMQEIRKILRAISEEIKERKNGRTNVRTNGRTYEGHSIEPFREAGVQLCIII